jgi:hypothetical protein
MNQALYAHMNNKRKMKKKKKHYLYLSLAGHTYDPGTQGAEAGQSQV